jgi:hypothetical protein
VGVYLFTVYYSQQEVQMEADSKPVPIGVWIFWAIVAVFGLGFLASRFDRFGTALSFTANLISVFAATGATVAAYLAVRELRNERKEDRSNRKPYFSFIEGKVGNGEDEESQYGYSGFVRATCRNVGTNRQPI